MDVARAGWRKSSHSGSNGGNCVEVADHDRRVLIRDTKQAATGPCSGSPRMPGAGSLTW
jgi:Domain of unknown function (DUF397)